VLPEFIGDLRARHQRQIGKPMHYQQCTPRQVFQYIIERIGKVGAGVHGKMRVVAHEQRDLVYLACQNRREEEHPGRGNVDQIEAGSKGKKNSQGFEACIEGKSGSLVLWRAKAKGVVDGYFAIETIQRWGWMDSIGCYQLELVSPITMVTEVLHEQPKSAGLAAHVGDGGGLAKNAYLQSVIIIVLQF